MSRTRFAVDWDDPAFPKIVVDEDGDTLAEAKAEIREHFQNQIDDARSGLRWLRTVRVDNLRGAR